MMRLTIPNGKFIASCLLIQDCPEAEVLPDVPEELSDFASHVVSVNKELAAGYIKQQQFGRQEKVPQVQKAKRRELWQWLYENLRI